MAAIIAEALNVPMDVIVPRKIGYVQTQRAWCGMCWMS